jgi:hypothetical protein
MLKGNAATAAVGDAGIEIDEAILFWDVLGGNSSFEVVGDVLRLRALDGTGLSFRRAEYSSSELQSR